MADGLFYNDLREPFISANLATIAPLATAVALYTPSDFPVLGGQYFSRLGKKLHIRLFGKITTAATPGNGSFAIYYGTGVSANGVLLASSTPVALLANQTDLSWQAEVFVHCRSLGSIGTLFCDGSATFNNAVIAAANQPLLIPASSPVVSAACDLTAALIISVQFIRSGSTAEAMTVCDMEVTAYN